MALFTKRHYLAAAQHLRISIASLQSRCDVAEIFVEMFRRDSTAFDTDLFIINAGLKDYCDANNLREE